MQSVLGDILIAIGGGAAALLGQYLLAKYTEKFKIRFSHLHAQRAEAIKCLYGKLVDAQQALSDALDVAPGPDERADRLQKAGAIADEFRRFFQRNRILFAEEVCSLVDELWESLKDIYYAQEDSPRLGSKKAREGLHKKFGPLKVRLEQEFRTILGVGQ